MKTSLVAIVFLGVIILFSHSIVEARLIYVDDDMDTHSNGSSWNNAFKYLRGALESAGNGDTVIVAQGTYDPIGPYWFLDPREAAFVLNRGVALYGGYAGIVGNDPDERNVQLYETILSGDIGVAGENYDNSFHVINGSNCDSSSILDGVTVMNGNANGSGDNSFGGGIKNYNGSPTIQNCVFKDNNAIYVGGAMINFQTDPVLENCTFINNSGGDGGAVYNILSSPHFINCMISSNSAYQGGAIRNNSSDAVFLQCIFVDNTASYGGAIYNEESNVSLINCTVAGNWANQAGGIYNTAASNPEIINSILWGNTDYNDTGESAQLYGGSPSVTYSCIRDDNPDDSYIPFGGAINNNIDDDPMFVAPYGIDGILGTVDDNLRLAPGSVCIDSGSTVTNPPLPAKDMDGEDRIIDGIVDMGPYEGASAPEVVNSVENSDTVSMAFHALPTHRYRLLESTDLINWTVAEDWRTGEGALMEFQQTIESDNSKFYKIECEAIE